MVTRPAQQAKSLCRILEEAGAQVIRWPVIGIEDPQDLASARAVVDRIAEFDLAVFVSVNAAWRGMRLIGEREVSWRHLKTFAVGKATAVALRQLGLTSALYPPKDYSTEGLLSMEELQPHAVTGRHIVIFRGEGGREVLAQALRDRGARVEYAEVYRRTCPDSDPRVVEAHWACGQLDIIVVTSVEALNNLVHMFRNQRERLLGTAVLITSRRLATHVCELGFSQPPVVAKNAGDACLLEALRAWQHLNAT